MAGGYLDVNLVALLALANSGWFPCLIMIYLSFVFGWRLMVCLGGPTTPPPSHFPLGDFTLMFFMGSWGVMVLLLELLHSWLGTLNLLPMGVKLSGCLTHRPQRDYFNPFRSLCIKLFCPNLKLNDCTFGVFLERPVHMSVFTLSHPAGTLYRSVLSRWHSGTGQSRRGNSMYQECLITCLRPWD